MYLTPPPPHTLTLPPVQCSDERRGSSVPPLPDGDLLSVDPPTEPGPVSEYSHLYSTASQCSHEEVYKLAHHYTAHEQIRKTCSISLCALPSIYQTISVMYWEQVLLTSESVNEVYSQKYRVTNVCYTCVHGHTRTD